MSLNNFKLSIDIINPLISPHNIVNLSWFSSECIQFGPRKPATNHRLPSINLVKWHAPIIVNTDHTHALVDCIIIIILIIIIITSSIAISRATSDCTWHTAIGDKFSPMTACQHKIIFLNPSHFLFAATFLTAINPHSQR